MLIPTKEQWGELSSQDVYYAFSMFGGKSNEEMQKAFEKNLLERCNDLEWMPIIPFKYYIFALKRYIEDIDMSRLDAADAASCFVELISSKVNSHPSEMSDIYIELSDLLNFIADNQEDYGADPDIYGDLKSQIKQIDEVMRREKGL